MIPRNAELNLCIALLIMALALVIAPLLPIVWEIAVTAAGILTLFVAAIDHAINWVWR
jgi:hypothetical protein